VSERHARRVLFAAGVTAAAVMAAAVAAVVTATAADRRGEREKERGKAAALVTVCPGDPEVASNYRTSYESPTGARTTLIVSAATRADATDATVPGCASVRVPVAVSAIVWARLVTAETVKRLGAGLLLQGEVDGGPSPNSEIIPLDTPDPPPGARTEAVAASSSPPSSSSSSSSSNTPPRALWAWRPEAWRNGGAPLLARAALWKADTIYITIPITSNGEVASADELRQFLREAARRGVHVWVVAGDPRAVLPSERPSFEARARAYVAFNAAASSANTTNEAHAARLAGIQYDIEPYLVSGYHLDEDGWKDAYVETIATLARAAPELLIEIAVPFWWLDANGSSPAFVDRLAPSIASIAIMDYRTNAAAIERFARPWLAWGARHRKRIRVALEAGPIPDEPRYHFRPAPAGTLWQVAVGSHHALLLLSSPGANRSGPTFARIGQSMSSGATQTFHGRIDQLRAMLPDLERTFAAYDAFGGIALHEVPEVVDAPGVDPGR
jgi:hypothetical protein